MFSLRFQVEILQLLRMQTRLSLCENFSFAPSGAALFRTFTHGLRRGLHSCAAARLTSGFRFHFNCSIRVLQQTLTSQRFVQLLE